MRIDSGESFWNPITWLTVHVFAPVVNWVDDSIVKPVVSWVEENIETILTAVLIVGVVALTIATAGTFGVIGSIIIGATFGASLGAGRDILSQGFANGFDNINWNQVGMAALTGAVSGAIGGGIGTGMRYVRVVNNLRKSGVKDTIKIKEITSAFRGGIPGLRNVKAGTDVFRVHGGKASPISNWVSTKQYADPVRSPALKPEWENNVSMMSVIRLNSPVKALVGRAVRQGSLPGGGIQWYIHNRNAMSVLRTWGR
jgi:hypothetical protein